MYKHIITIFLTVWFTIGFADNNYYLQNPKRLQKDIKSCEKLKNCNELQEIAMRLNQLGLELQMSPQEFGSKILYLQQNIANLENSFKKDSKTEVENLKQQHTELEERLAVVKWLESPES